MEIVSVVAGFTIQEEDDFRRSIARSHTKSITKFEKKFYLGAEERGLSKSERDEIWLLLKGAGAYMFNKAHSSCYAYIAYQMMFLKTYYPTEFWAATLNSKIGDEKKLNIYLRILIQQKYEILPVTVKDSQASFCPVTEGVIRAGFKRVKGIGEKAAIELSKIEHRDTLQEWITSLADPKINRRGVGKGVIEALDKAGAFNCYGLEEEEKQRLLSVTLKTSSSKKSKAKIKEIYLFGEEPKKAVYQTVRDYLEERRKKEVE